MRPITGIAGLLLLVPFALAARCGSVALRILEPASGSLLTCMPFTVVLDLAPGLDTQTIELRLDGLDSFGEVWLAVEVLTRIYRAIKIISGGKAARRVELEGVREYQQRSRGHPNLIQVLTVGEADGSLYYVMEAADNDLGSQIASPQDYEPKTLASVLVRERGSTRRPPRCPRPIPDHRRGSSRPGLLP